MGQGFAAGEYRARLGRAQQFMSHADLGALLLTTEPEVRYFTGYLTRFWESPTRPWFLVVPASGDPVAVVPQIGAPLMSRSWISDIRTWVSPDLTDDGVTLLSETLDELAPRARIGVPSGPETHLRMPLADYARLQMALGPERLVGDGGIMRSLRMVKSAAEIEKIETACAIADRAFGRVPEFATPGTGLDQVFRRFQMACLDEGADWVPYLAGGAGPFGYPDVISPATALTLAEGDVLMLDTGLVHDGYFCDYDRNVAIRRANDRTKSAHSRLIEATAAGFEATRPGATAADMYRAMDAVLTGGLGDGSTGRLGHGLGMQLTEWPSIIPTDDTVLEPGMVLTLEPGIEVDSGAGLVHEENIVVTDTGARWLTNPAAPDLRVI
jgi:Xaa-Pro aminopeptidase